MKSTAKLHLNNTQTQNQKRTQSDDLKSNHSQKKNILITMIIYRPKYRCLLLTCIVASYLLVNTPVLILTTSMTTSYNTANILLNKNNKITFQNKNKLQKQMKTNRLPKTSTSSQLATINKKI